MSVSSSAGSCNGGLRSAVVGVTAISLESFYRKNNSAFLDAFLVLDRADPEGFVDGFHVRRFLEGDPFHL